MKMTLYRVGLREVYITEDYIEVPIYNENDLVQGWCDRSILLRTIQKYLFIMKMTLYRVGLREVYITKDYIEVPIYNENNLVKGLFERGLYY